MDALNQAFIQHPVGMLFGFAAIILVSYIGLSILFNGWPKFKK